MNQEKLIPFCLVGGQVEYPPIVTEGRYNQDGWCPHTYFPVPQSRFRRLYMSFSLTHSTWDSFARTSSFHNTEQAPTLPTQNKPPLLVWQDGAGRNDRHSCPFGYWSADVQEWRPSSPSRTECKCQNDTPESAMPLRHHLNTHPSHLASVIPFRCLLSPGLFLGTVTETEGKNQAIPWAWVHWVGMSNHEVH